MKSGVDAEKSMSVVNIVRILVAILAGTAAILTKADSNVSSQSNL